MMLNADPEVVASFTWYAAVVVAKMLFVGFPLTAAARFATKTFISPEDAILPGTKCGTNETVERVRRAHRNDLENIVPFVLIGLLYVLTAQPSLFVAKLHFQIFTAARIGHTVAYLLSLPARGACFGVGALVCLSMILQIIF